MTAKKTPLNELLPVSILTSSIKGGAMTAKSSPVGHTPGEWRLVEFLKGRKGMLHRIHNEYGITIADIPCDPTDSQEGHRANARLIAVAPEMLERLTCLLCNLEAGRDCIAQDANFKWDIGDLNDEIEATKAAIRKARGE